MPPRKHPMRRSRPKELVAKYVPELEERVFASGVDIDRVHYGTYAMSQAEPVVIPKTVRFDSELYRRRVAAMPCAICGAVGISQAAHMNGGGMGTKHDDRLTFAACADQPGRRGCHMANDQSGGLEKADRRRREARLVLRTIRSLIKSGAWPMSVPRLDDARMRELESWAK